MLEKVTEMTTEPIIGKFYLVPVANVDINRQVPIIPIWHDDADIGINYHHYHLDVRFMPENDLDYDIRFPRDVATLGIILADRKKAEYYWRWVVTAGDWTYRRRKCRRRMPQMREVRNFNTIETKMLGRKINCGKCPHRGFPLESLPKDENGHVICNGHGLKIDMNKREVVKR